MGRPTSYTQEVANELCAYIACGESLRKACGHANMPSVKTVFNWMHSDENFLQQYARAKEAQADVFVEDIQEIADNVKKDYLPLKDADGNVTGYVESKNAVQRAKLRIESRKWLAMKLKPKKYGELLKVEGKQEHTGHLEHTHSYKSLTDDELLSRAKKLLEENAAGGSEE